MNNKERLSQIFMDCLNIDLAIIVDELTYNSIPEWDSVAHMALVSEIEDQFDIMLDTDDILDMNSFGKAKEIIARYDISFK